MTGSAVALRTRSETLAGPGPIMVFCGTLIGDSRDFAGGIVTEDILMIDSEGKVVMRNNKLQVNASARAAGVCSVYTIPGGVRGATSATK